jgi:hypothetical protein
MRVPAKLQSEELERNFWGPPEEVNNQYQAEMGLPSMKYKNLDTSSSRMDDSIVNYYSNQWDDFIALENRLRGYLPDSLLIRID